MRKIQLVILFFFILKISFSQGVNDTSIFVPMCKFSYAFQIPGGDLANRFGYNSNIGAEFSIKTKTNWILGLEGFFLFGDMVKETFMFDSLRSTNGEIINEFGEYANIILYERGFYFGANLGKLIPIWGPNTNSGIIISGGAGLLQHKIRIENEGNNTPSINGKYIKGYDRLSNGLAAKIFIGYLYLGKRKLKNFTVGFEFYQAWSKNRRDINFDTMQKDDKLRKDLLYSVKLSWVLPIYVGKPEKYYTN